jgi:hypothetical protein
VELSDAVAADLAALTVALDEPVGDLAVQLQQLGDSCALAVGSYLGISITLVVDEVPVTVTILEDFLDPSEIGTSLMIPLTVLGDHGPGSQIVLYAATAGAFVDLAADLSYASGAGPDVAQLDQHLRPPDHAAEVTGLTALRLQNQAIGILIDRGDEADVALARLRRRALLEGISIELAVQTVIDSVVGPRPA